MIKTIHFLISYFYIFTDSSQSTTDAQGRSPKMSGHGHSHSGGHGHSHSHEDLEGAERGNLFSLYLKIDTEKVECLNEESEGSGKDVFKPWDQRLDTEKVYLLLHYRSECERFLVVIYLIHHIPSEKTLSTLSFPSI